jgi:hypothetical protein
MMLNELYNKWSSYCSKCGRVKCGRVASGGPVYTFIHDIKCWGFKVAAYNLWYRIRFSMQVSDG